MYQALVATDIAARGIDVEALGHVVNFDVPLAPDDYIHRVGRTARAEATGEAFTFVSPEEEGDLKQIERAIGKQLPRVTVPGFDYTAKPQARLEVPLAERIAEIRKKKAEDRARAAAKLARRGGSAPAPAARRGPAKPASSSNSAPKASPYADLFWWRALACGGTGGSGRQRRCGGRSGGSSARRGPRRPGGGSSVRVAEAAGHDEPAAGEAADAHTFVHHFMHFTKNAVYGAFLMLGSMVGGTIGFHALGPAAWIDAWLNAAMLLGGMGPVGDPRRGATAGKMFASLFALYAGLVVPAHCRTCC